MGRASGFKAAGEHVSRIEKTGTTAEDQKMNSERHLDDLSMVIIANTAGWMPTLLDMRDIIQVLGLLAALVYTSLKIVDWCRDNWKRRK